MEFGLILNRSRWPVGYWFKSVPTESISRLCSYINLGGVGECFNSALHVDVRTPFSTLLLFLFACGTFHIDENLVNTLF